MDQLKELKLQMQAHFQILLQTYAQQREVYGKPHPETQYWEQNLRCVSANDYCATVLTTGKQ